MLQKVLKTGEKFKWKQYSFISICDPRCFPACPENFRVSGVNQYTLCNKIPSGESLQQIHIKRGQNIAIRSPLAKVYKLMRASSLREETEVNLTNRGCNSGFCLDALYIDLNMQRLFSFFFTSVKFSGACSCQVIIQESKRIL